MDPFSLMAEIGAGKSRMSDTAYDTAWVARLGEIAPDISYTALEWLSEHQLKDGSWGSKYVFYYHDRVACTLAATIALHKQGRRSQDRQRTEKGLIALEQITSGLTQGLLADPNGATVGFEVIVPTLVAEAEQLGIIKQQGERILGRIGKLRAAKLKRLGDRKINKYVTMAFSAEMAGNDSLHMLDVANLQESNGSLAESPSASAYFAKFIQPGDPAALAYLRSIVSPAGGVPNVAPIDVFEMSWTLWNLSLITGFPAAVNKPVQKHLKFLADSWQPGLGLAYASACSAPDSDDSALVCEVLSRYGYQFDGIQTVLSYEEQDHFRCCGLESNPSISANVHILCALRQLGFTADHPAIQKILGFLRRTKRNDFWCDKWNISPYYVSSHAVIACAGLDNELINATIDWLVQSQKSDGSWGFGISTAEETAYALQALWVWNTRGGHISRDCFSRGRTWLLNHIEPPYPPLWLGKCLYSPELVIQSAIVSALSITG
jgi:halimadienyl-diphosphate synthase